MRKETLKWIVQIIASIATGAIAHGALVADSLKQLERANCKLMGVVLNRVSADYYRYGKYSKYGYSSGSPESIQASISTSENTTRQASPGFTSKGTGMNTGTSASTGNSILPIFTAGCTSAVCLSASKEITVPGRAQ